VGLLMHAQIVASGRTVYETPASVFDPLDAEFHFTLDVCADFENAKVRSFFFTPEADGLSKRWAPERCWLNPPYGRQMPQWMRKAYEESLNGALVVALVPASTDTRWWHDWIEGKAEVRFVKGRIKFVGAQWTAPHPHAIVIWRPA
jgi:phage N-6-adenine-methyltransferase